MPWYAVLGNHDYGDGAKAGAPPPECPPPTPRSACFPSPLHQVCTGHNVNCFATGALLHRAVSGLRKCCENTQAPCWLATTKESGCRQCNSICLFQLTELRRLSSVQPRAWLAVACQPHLFGVSTHIDGCALH